MQTQFAQPKVSDSMLAELAWKNYNYIRRTVDMDNLSEIERENLSYWLGEHLLRQQIQLACMVTKKLSPDHNAVEADRLIAGSNAIETLLYIIDACTTEDAKLIDNKLQDILEEIENRDTLSPHVEARLEEEYRKSQMNDDASEIEDHNRLDIRPELLPALRVDVADAKAEAVRLEEMFLPVGPNSGDEVARKNGMSAVLVEIQSRTLTPCA